MGNNSLHVKKMLLTAIFAAISIVVGNVEIVWPFLPFLKIDFSEVVILIGFAMIGLPRTIVVIFLRSLVRELIANKPFEPIPVIGEVMAIVASLVLVLLYKFIIMKKQEKNAILNENENSGPSYSLNILSRGLFVSFIFAIFMTALNFFIIFPMFISLLEHLHFVSFVNDPSYAFITKGSLWGYTTYIITLVLPFNLIKGVATLTVFEIVKAGLSHIYFNEKNSNEIYKENKGTNS